MKPSDLDIAQWNALLERYKETPNYRAGAAMRIENTMFTSARWAGGMTYNGETYKYFEPVDPTMPANDDGTPYVAWLMVRWDFLRWVEKELKAAKKGGAK